MRTMNLPEVPIGPSSLDGCVQLYCGRLAQDQSPMPRISMLLTAYMAWPNNESERDSFAATHVARSVYGDTPSPGDRPTEVASDWADFERFGGLGAVTRTAFGHLMEEIAKLQGRWLLVSDIMHVIADMAYDNRVTLRGGASIAKAIDLCENERVPGHSQLRNAWSEFRDVAHLIAAGAHLAHQGLTECTKVHEASILNAVWVAPDAVLALAAGFQEFGLQPKTVKKEAAILRVDKLWRIPTSIMPQKPFIVYRHLTDEQLAFLRTRRAPKKGIHRFPAKAPVNTL
jgi:hypothetical protein